MTDETTPTTKRPRMTPEERVKRDRERLEASERKAAEAAKKKADRAARALQASANRVRNARYNAISAANKLIHALRECHYEPATDLPVEGGNTIFWQELCDIANSDEPLDSRRAVI